MGDKPFTEEEAGKVPDKSFISRFQDLPCVACLFRECNCSLICTGFETVLCTSRGKIQVPTVEPFDKCYNGLIRWCIAEMFLDDGMDTDRVHFQVQTQVAKPGSAFRVSVC